MKVLILDNYDSFTYNLVQYIQEILHQDVTVIRNDKMSLQEVDDYDVIILSPGPGLPKDAGIMPELIRQYAGKKPILGVCLGHQAIGEAFGAKLKNLDKVYHGFETPIEVLNNKRGLFKSLPMSVNVGRYHSWVIDNTTLPDEMEVTAIDERGEIMALKHKQHDVYGVQFHPESIMTKEGKKMLLNFFESVARRIEHWEVL